MARLQDYYKETVVQELTKKFGYKTEMEVPRITKITLNMAKPLPTRRFLRQPLVT